MKRKIPKKFLEYEESYRAFGISMLLADIFREFTRKRFDILTTCSAGIVKQYFGSDSAKLLFDGAVSLCSNTRALSKFLDRYKDLKKNQRSFLNIYFHCQYFPKRTGFRQ